MIEGAHKLPIEDVQLCPLHPVKTPSHRRMSRAIAYEGRLSAGRAQASARALRWASASVGCAKGVQQATRRRNLLLMSSRCSGGG